MFQRVMFEECWNHGTSFGSEDELGINWRLAKSFEDERSEHFLPYLVTNLGPFGNSAIRAIIINCICWFRLEPQTPRKWFPGASPGTEGWVKFEVVELFSANYGNFIAASPKNVGPVFSQFSQFFGNMGKNRPILTKGDAFYSNCLPRYHLK